MPGPQLAVAGPDPHVRAPWLDARDVAPLIDAHAQPLRFLPQAVHQLHRIEDPAAGDPDAAEVERAAHFGLNRRLIQ